MTVIDTSLLIYAYDEDSPFHAATKLWLKTLIASREQIGIPLPVVTAFLRLTTNRMLRGGQFSMAEAIQIVDEWFALPQIRLLLATERHWSVLRRVLLDSQSSGTITTDAHIAAITLEYGGTLYSHDRDFARFPGLRWTNPLQSK